MEEIDVLEEVKNAVDILNRIDEYHVTLSDRLSALDSRTQDLLHYIESNSINVLWCYRMIKELKTIRIERRKVKNDMELLTKYTEVKNRLTSKDSRTFILSELHKRNKQLQTTYKNRQYTEEDIQKIIKGV